VPDILAEERPLERLLTTPETALVFRVEPETVLRWAAAGLIPSTKTPTGYYRFKMSDVRALLEAGQVLTDELASTAAVLDSEPQEARGGA
jgi:excisionase family DNA binding protein